MPLTLDSLGIEDMSDRWSNDGRTALDFALAFPDVRTLTAIEPAAYWLVDGEGARAGGELIADCAGRECGEDDVRQFLVGVGVAGPDTDFSALPQWELWLACRQVLRTLGSSSLPGGHASMLESPQAFLAALNEHVAGNRATPSAISATARFPRGWTTGFEPATAWTTTRSSTN
jgi:hypothetical protein